jgi:multiple antibiotic resistance protein
MITPAFIFTIFMLTLGPVKTVPTFFALTQGRAPSYVRALALKGTAVATAVSLLIALVMTGLAASWRISPDDVRLAGGILLFLASRDVIEQFNRPAPPPLRTTPSKQPAVTPLAIPTIVTPWGVTAILFFAELAYDDPKLLTAVNGILLLIMLLNLIGMLLARPLIAAVGIVSFQVSGWIFAVSQAGLAADAVVTSLRHLALFHPMP